MTRATLLPTLVLVALNAMPLTAQPTGTAASLPLAASATSIQNTEPMPLTKGIVASALKIDFSHSLLDTPICEAFTEVIVTDWTHPCVPGVRARVIDGRIAALESLVTDADDWLFNAYFDVLDDNQVQVPWGTPCNRMEGGARTGKGLPDDSCTVGVPANGGMKLTDRRFIADPEIGTVVGFIRCCPKAPGHPEHRVGFGRSPRTR